MTSDLNSEIELDSIVQSPIPSEYLYNPDSLLQSTNEMKIKTEMHVDDKPQSIVLDTKKQKNTSECISKPKIKVFKKMANTVNLDTKLENKSDTKHCVKAESVLINQEVSSANITGK